MKIDATDAVAALAELVENGFTRDFRIQDEKLVDVTAGLTAGGTDAPKVASEIQPWRLTMAVKFENTRFDPDLIEFHGIAKQLATSVGYTADLSIDAQLAQLLRLRVAQMNPCSYCLILHTNAAHERGIATEKVAHLASWRESTMYSDAERCALAYCEALVDYDQSTFSGRHEKLAMHFEEKAVAEIAAIVINMTLWTRLKLAQGQVPVEE